jgi:hypothetical protein
MIKKICALALRKFVIIVADATKSVIFAIATAESIKTDLFAYKIK